MSLKIDLTPLRKSADYRSLFVGQAVSYIGTAISHVALQYQVYQVSKSATMTGLLGVVQLVPLSLSGFIGGGLADRFNRKRLIVVSEILLTVLCLTMAVWSFLGQVPIWFLFLFGGLGALLTGLHRPSLESMTPQLVTEDLIPAVSALQGFIRTFGMIAAPGLSGIILATMGVGWTYLVDAMTYLFSIYMILRIRKDVTLQFQQTTHSFFKDIVYGLKYAWQRKLLLGTYFVDMAAMTLAFPIALFPKMSEEFGSASSLGWLHSSIAIGAFVATLLSGWTQKKSNHGQLITLSAVAWCLFISLAGYFSHNLYLVVACLVLAGYVDMISGIFRSIVWNQTIPTEVRGRMAGVEMLSYMSGPLLGGALIGWNADRLQSAGGAMVLGGLTGAALVIVLVIWLREFWRYEAR